MLWHARRSSETSLSRLSSVGCVDHVERFRDLAGTGRQRTFRRRTRSRLLPSADRLSRGLGRPTRRREGGWNRRRHGLTDAPKPPPVTAIRSTSDIDRSTSSIDRSTSSIDRSTSDIDRSTSRIDRSTSSIDRSTSSIDRSTSSIDRSTSSIDRSTSGIDRSTSDIDRSTSGIDRSTSSIDRSTSGIDRSTSSIDRSTSGIHLSFPQRDCPTAAGRPRRAAQRRPAERRAARGGH